MARIVLNTFGSFGDLHPFLALALELRRRNHTPVIATSEVYRPKIQAEGLEFAPVRPDVAEIIGSQDLLAKLWDRRKGTEYLVRDYLAPAILESYRDLEQAAAGADLLLTHPAAFAGPLVAEKYSLPWLSIVLQSSIFLSVYDPPIVPETWIRHLYPLGRTARSLLFNVGRARVNSWAKPVLALRRQLGLPARGSPLFEGAFSPHGTLALFSPEWAQPQPDWPARVTITGFVFYDKLGPALVPGQTAQHSDALPFALADFLEAGEPPVVFTLGSSAVTQPGSFYRESIQAVRELGRRAILLSGALTASDLGVAGDSSIFVASYAPYSALLPRAAATVHQGGIGTTAQALRSGRPMLIVPWAHDQPDNGERSRRLGVARVLERTRYTGARAAKELRPLLESASYQIEAARVGARISSENGLARACETIEAVLV